MPQLSKEAWDKYCQEADALRERGVLVGDVLVCDEGAQPRLHAHTQKPCVRISEYCVIDGTGPRFFVHGFHRGLVGYVPDETYIEPGTKLRVTKKFEHSVVLELQDAN